MKNKKVFSISRVFQALNELTESKVGNEPTKKRF